MHFLDREFRRNINRFREHDDEFSFEHVEVFIQ